MVVFAVLMIFVLPDALGAPAFLSETGIGRANQGEGGYTVYRRQNDCESRESEPCYDVANAPPQTHSIQTVMEDDTSNPIYARKSKITSCSGRDDCFTKMAGLCAHEPEGSFSVVSEAMDEVYCTRITGYNQVPAKKLLEDTGLLAAKVAREQALSDAKLEAMQRKARLQVALDDPTVSDTVKDLIREVVKQ